MDDWLSQLRRGTVELCILALLRRRERYGYEIVEELNAAGRSGIAEGTVYPLLKRLGAQGWVSSNWSESPSGPPRKYYRLTPAGQAYLARIRQQWQQFARMVDQMVQGASDDQDTQLGESKAHRRLPGEVPPKPLAVARRAKR